MNRFTLSSILLQIMKCKQILQIVLVSDYERNSKIPLSPKQVFTYCSVSKNSCCNSRRFQKTLTKCHLCKYVTLLRNASDQNWGSDKSGFPLKTVSYEPE